MSTTKLSKIRRADPFFDREVEKYQFPLPSREYIVQVLAEQGRPLYTEDLCALLDIQPDEGELFGRRLRAMERDGDLMRNRKGAYIVPDKADLIAGRVEGHADGFGFLRPDRPAGAAAVFGSGGKEGDIYLDAKQMSRVLHGDRALVRIVGTDRRGRPEGVVVEILERANREVVGRLRVDHGVVHVTPEDRRISQDILIPPPEKKSRKRQLPEPGSVVVVEILTYPTRYSQAIGQIKEVLGNFGDSGMEIEIALRKHDLPFQFSKAVQEETKAIPDRVRKPDWKDREDLTGLDLVTIDGETAKDFDDAVFAEKVGRSYRLVVAIADVSHYVRPGSALDEEAYARGNSVYFPRRVIPMLPEKLSNGICSLNPEVERMAMVCDMVVGTTGKISSYRFYPAVFRSKARLTYNQVWNWLSGAEQPDEPRHMALQPALQTLYKLYQILAKARVKRGAIDFETVETQMIFNDEGKIDNIVPVVRNDAHRVIEECMLAANVCASNFLESHKAACLYRVHGGPSPAKLETLREFLKEFGLGLTGGDDPQAKDYSTLLEQVKARPDAEMLQTVMLRSLQQAVYSPDNVGHFGLAYEAYTHFTSPIRRYPDLLVHRAIKAVLAGEVYRPPLAWEEVGIHCSATERRADEATRDVTNWLKCFYMKERIGEEFDGSVAAVVPFGIFVALDEVYVEGLVHISDLGEDYFHHDPLKHWLIGERTHQTFRLADRVRVRLVRADLESGRIDFQLVTGTPGRVARRGNRAGVPTTPAPVPAPVAPAVALTSALTPALTPAPVAQAAEVVTETEEVRPGRRRGKKDAEAGKPTPVPMPEPRMVPPPVRASKAHTLAPITTAAQEDAGRAEAEKGVGGKEGKKKAGKASLATTLLEQASAILAQAVTRVEASTPQDVPSTPEAGRSAAAPRKPRAKKATGATAAVAEPTPTPTPTPSITAPAAPAEALPEAPAAAKPRRKKQVAALLQPPVEAVEPPAVAPAPAPESPEGKGRVRRKKTAKPEGEA